MSTHPYLASLRIRGTTLRTLVYAECSLHARLMLEYQFGLGSVIGTPTRYTGRGAGYTPVSEVIKTIKPIAPLTPEQGRIQALKQRKDSAGKALAAERERQRITKANRRLSNLSR
jgi:hypothetical protein